MVTVKSFTNLEQSKKLAEILPIESADMSWVSCDNGNKKYFRAENCRIILNYEKKHWIPCWSLTALLKYLSEINQQVYTPTLFPSEGKWILHFVEYGHGIVCEASCDNPIDACYELILKLHELKML